MYQTSYARAKSLEEASRMFAEGEDSRYLSGGITLIPTMKQRLAAPDRIIDLAHIPELKGIRRESDTIRIGAGTTHGEIAASADVKEAIAGLAHMALHIGDPQVRHKGTLGGALANNDPAACYPAAVLALGATVHTDKREIAADEFFQGLFETALEEGEIVTAVTFPVPQSSAYCKFPNPASRYAMAAVFVARLADGPRVAVTGASGSGVFRWRQAEEALAGDFSAKALEGVELDSSSFMSDIHATADYRDNLVRVMAKRAVEGQA